MRRLLIIARLCVRLCVGLCGAGWFGAPALAQCPRPSSQADLVTGIEQAQSAYSDLDLGAFREAVHDLRDLLPCMIEPLTLHSAAEVHRFEGLLGFVERNPERSKPAFAAARALEPNYRFPDALVPPGNGALADYFALDPDAGAPVTVAQPLHGRILFDGQPTADRPTTFPTIVQLVDATGEVTITSYLWPGDPLPRYAPRPPPDTRTDAFSGNGKPTPVRNGPDRGLLTGAVVSALASGVLYGGAFVVHTRYYADGAPFEQLGTLRTVNNSLVAASGVALGAAVGLGTGSLLAVQR